MAETFADTRVEDMAPIRWLGALAETMARVLGERQDAELAILKEAVSMRVPAFCPDDALGLLAQNLKIPTFFGELPERLRARLSIAFTTWEGAGLPRAIAGSLGAWGLANAQITNWSDVMTPDEWFSKFCVTIGPPMPWSEPVWGNFNWGEEQWGLNITESEKRQIIGQVLFWKSPQSLPEAIIIDPSGAFDYTIHPGGELTWDGSVTILPLANLWGSQWVKWGEFNWGNGKWINGEITV